MKIYVLVRHDSTELNSTAVDLFRSSTARDKYFLKQLRSNPGFVIRWEEARDDSERAAKAGEIEWALGHGFGIYRDAVV